MVYPQRELIPDQIRVLKRIYDEILKTGRWPRAQALRYHVYKADKLKLEEVAAQISDLATCNDISRESSTCIIHVEALRYIDAAAGDRTLIGKLVAWLVECYLKGDWKDLTREQAAAAIEADQASTDRAMGFVHYVAGLLKDERPLGDDVLGCLTFGIDERIVDFDGVDSYESFLEARTQRALKQRERNERRGLPASAPELARPNLSYAKERRTWGNRWVALDGRSPIRRGQGAVWQVWDKREEHLEPWKRQRFALKELRYDAGPDSAKYRRFAREIEKTRTLSELTPHIVGVVDQGASTDGGDSELFYVMPLASGSLDRAKDLAGHIEQILEIGVAVAEALMAAHEAGIIHRDVKPGNILLFGDERRPALADFGICYLVDDDRLTSEEAPTVGSKDFVAPELLGGGRVDTVGAPADVYSLGKTLYAVAAGGDVFPREGHRAPDWDLVMRAKDTRLAHLHGLLDNMVTENPDCRYKTMRDARVQLARALDNIKAEVPYSAGMYGGGDTAVERAVRFQTALESLTGTKLRDLSQRTLDEAITAAQTAASGRRLRHDEYARDPAVHTAIRDATNNLLSAGLPLIDAADEEHFSEWISVVAEPINRKGPAHHQSYSRSVLRAAGCLAFYGAIGSAWTLRRWSHLRLLLTEVTRDPADYLHLDNLAGDRTALYQWLASEVNELSVVRQLGASDSTRIAIASGLVVLFGMRASSNDHPIAPYPGFNPEAAAVWVPQLARTLLTRRAVEAAIGSPILGFPNWPEIRPWAASIEPRIAASVAKYSSNRLVEWDLDIDPTREWARWTSATVSW